MGMSLFDKAQLVVKSKLHALLDREVNTPEGYKQLIRDLEVAMADLQAGVDEAVGTGNGYKRDITNWNSEIVQNQGNIDLILGDGDESNDESAVQLQLENQRLQGQVTQRQQLLEEQQASTSQLQSALTQLEAKHQQMLANLAQLTQTQAIARAKNRASSAVEAATQVADDANSVDSIQATLDHQKDVADARFDRVIGGLSATQSPEEVANLARAKAALEARRASLTAQAKSTEPAPAS